MAQISFNFKDSKTSSPCTIYRGRYAEIYFCIDGYEFIVPQARDFCDVVEHLIILQEAFENGITITDSHISCSI